MNKSVLIVEDDEAISGFISAILSSNDYNILKTKKGKEAVLMAASYCPDLILLDLGLPDMDGVEVLKTSAPAAIPRVTTVAVITTQSMVTAPSSARSRRAIRSGSCIMGAPYRMVVRPSCTGLWAKLRRGGMKNGRPRGRPSCAGGCAEIMSVVAAAGHSPDVEPLPDVEPDTFWLLR